TGPAGPSGKIELVSCTTITRTVHRHHHRVRSRHQRCRARLVSGTVKFTTATAAARATIVRGRTAYARGISVPTVGGSRQLVLRGLRPLRAGRYTLIVKRRRRARWTTSRRPIRIV
ncbi:MAG: hypothetical protein ACRDNS_11465, partial [Trebonia sp.]